MVTLEDRVELVLAEAMTLLPPIKTKAWISEIALDDLGAKHGNYAPDTGVLTLSTRLFWGETPWELMTIDEYGCSPAESEQYCSRALHTTIHEIFHAIGTVTRDDQSPAWLNLSGWQRTWEDRPSTGRYFERRPGWDEQGGSEWCYRKGTWFCRDYASKSPFEDYADCGTHIALGWHQGITNRNAMAKIRYLQRTAWGEGQDARLQVSASTWRKRWKVTLGER